jgi:hypothetical protein
LALGTRQGGTDVKKLVCGAALAALVAGGTAGAAGPALTPHVYGVKITGSSVPLFNATWLLGITQSSFKLARNGKVVVTGTAAVSGRRIVLRDSGGSLACKPSEGAGTYTWARAGKKLTFTKVSDRCVGRRLILSVPYTLVR